LAPRDDLESLSYTTYLFLRGNLPWYPRPIHEEKGKSEAITRLMKSESTGSLLCPGLPEEFWGLLTSSRSLKFEQLPDYSTLKSSFASLATSLDLNITTDKPLNWNASSSDTIASPFLSDPIARSYSQGQHSSECWDGRSSSYFGWDATWWTSQGERDSDLVLPSELEVSLDRQLPHISEVEENFFGERKIFGLDK
jgi:hypothetical protein